MSARATHIGNMIPELDAMREAVAAASHADTDLRSQQAYRMQAKNLRTMYGQIQSTWFNTAQEVEAQTGETDEAVVELRYAERLGEWLRSHIETTTESLEGGDIDRGRDLSPRELYIARLAARRHHEMVADYCERHVAALAERAEELRASFSVHP